MPAEIQGIWTRRRDQDGRSAFTARFLDMPQTLSAHRAVYLGFMATGSMQKLVAR